MSTAAQQQANKENAKHSTGPRTEEGKQRSSQNALKHGFCAKDPLIRGEDPDDYYRHSAELELSLSPAGARILYPRWARFGGGGGLPKGNTGGGVSLVSVATSVCGRAPKVAHSATRHGTAVRQCAQHGLHLVG
jgi:hypothetical protein